MDAKNEFAVSSLMESIAREDFAIDLYSRQLHDNPFCGVPLTPYYYVLDEVYFFKAGPIKFEDLSGVVDIEVVHRQRFIEAVRQLNPRTDPVAKIEFPPGVFDSVEVPDAPLIPGMKSALRIAVTDIVQEQRAKAIYDFFMQQTEGWVRELYGAISFQEGAHRKIFEKILHNLTEQKYISITCPVCGKVLRVVPEEGKRGACGFCMSKLAIQIEDDDFVLKPLQ